MLYDTEKDPVDPPIIHPRLYSFHLSTPGIAVLRPPRRRWRQLDPLAPRARERDEAHPARAERVDDVDVGRQELVGRGEARPERAARERQALERDVRVEQRPRDGLDHGEQLLHIVYAQQAGAAKSGVIHPVAAHERPRVKTETIRARSGVAGAASWPLAYTAPSTLPWLGCCGQPCVQ